MSATRQATKPLSVCLACGGQGRYGGLWRLRAAIGEAAAQGPTAKGYTPGTTGLVAWRWVAGRRLIKQRHRQWNKPAAGEQQQSISQQQ